MKETMYELFTDVWRLADKYQFRPLNDAEWEAFVVEGKRLLTRYQQKGILIELLYRDLFSAVQEYYKNIGEDSNYGKKG